MINPPLDPIVAFAEEQSPELRDRIFAEFNTLSVIYRAPASSFVRAVPLEQEDGVALPLVRHSTRFFPSAGNYHHT